MRSSRDEKQKRRQRKTVTSPSLPFVSEYAIPSPHLRRGESFQLAGNEVLRVSLCWGSCAVPVTLDATMHCFEDDTTQVDFANVARPQLRYLLHHRRRHVQELEQQVQTLTATTGSSSCTEAQLSDAATLPSSSGEDRGDMFELDVGNVDRNIAGFLLSAALFSTPPGDTGGASVQSLLDLRGLHCRVEKAVVCPSPPSSPRGGGTRAGAAPPPPPVVEYCVLANIPVSLSSSSDGLATAFFGLAIRKVRGAMMPTLTAAAPAAPSSSTRELSARDQLQLFNSSMMSRSLAATDVPRVAGGTSPMPAASLSVLTAPPPLSAVSSFGPVTKKVFVRRGVDPASVGAAGAQAVDATTFLWEIVAVSESFHGSKVPAAHSGASTPPPGSTPDPQSLPRDGSWAHDADVVDVGYIQHAARLRGLGDPAGYRLPEVVYPLLSEKVNASSGKQSGSPLMSNHRGVSLDQIDTEEDDDDDDGGPTSGLLQSSQVEPFNMTDQVACNVVSHMLSDSHSNSAFSSRLGSPRAPLSGATPGGNAQKLDTLSACATPSGMGLQPPDAEKAMKALLRSVPRVVRDSTQRYNVGRSAGGGGTLPGCANTAFDDSSDEEEATTIECMKAVVPLFNQRAVVRFNDGTYNVGTVIDKLKRHYAEHRTEYEVGGGASLVPSKQAPSSAVHDLEASPTTPRHVLSTSVAVSSSQLPSLRRALSTTTSMERDTHATPVDTPMKPSLPEQMVALQMSQQRPKSKQRSASLWTVSSAADPHAPTPARLDATGRRSRGPIGFRADSSVRGASSRKSASSRSRMFGGAVTPGNVSFPKIDSTQKPSQAAVGFEDMSGTFTPRILVDNPAASLDRQKHRSQDRVVPHSTGGSTSNAQQHISEGATPPQPDFGRALSIDTVPLLVLRNGRNPDQSALIAQGAAAGDHRESPTTPRAPVDGGSSSKQRFLRQHDSQAGGGLPSLIASPPRAGVQVPLPAHYDRSRRTSNDERQSNSSAGGVSPVPRGTSPPALNSGPATPGPTSPLHTSAGPLHHPARKAPPTHQTRGPPAFSKELLDSLLLPPVNDPPSSDHHPALNPFRNPEINARRRSSIAVQPASGRLSMSGSGGDRRDSKRRSSVAGGGLSIDKLLSSVKTVVTAHGLASSARGAVSKARTHKQLAMTSIQDLMHSMFPHLASSGASPTKLGHAIGFQPRSPLSPGQQPNSPLTGKKGGRPSTPTHFHSL